jgi:hypothetical protein
VTPERLIVRVVIVLAILEGLAVVVAVLASRAWW